MLSLRLKRYYDPLRLPLRPAAISFPYTHQSMASPPLQRASRAARSILHRMPPLLPRESMCTTSVIPAHFQLPSPSDPKETLINLVLRKSRREFFALGSEADRFRELLGLFSMVSLPISPSRRNLGMRGEQPSAGQEEIGQSKQRKQLRGVLRQALVARLAVMEQGSSAHETDAQPWLEC